MIEENKIKNSFLIRIMEIPMFLKNYGMPLFNISLPLIIFTAIPDFLKNALRVYIGSLINFLK